ncbi:Uncharacterized protein SCF082_LOCUS10737 [Durusdinium trenchii]|uniref:Claudin n=1 Tax=Durusdinium trenchii TaxID=1381693 RepID=A0ABP0J8D2_9DINO
MPGNGERGTQGASCCLLIAFILALFATASPYWLYRSAWSYMGTSQTLSTGSWVMSTSSSRWRCGWYVNCYVSSQWNHFTDLDGNNTICTQPFFDQVGKFGFCPDGINSQPTTPSKVAAIQGLAITSTVMAFVACLTAAAAGKAGSKAGFAAGLFSFLTMVTSCAAFSVAASYDWYQSLDGAGYLPFIDDQGKLFVADNVYLYWGAAFWCFVIVFIISLLTTPGLCALAKELDSDDLDGTYGKGSSGSEYGGGAEPTYGGDAAYGVARA